VNKEIENLIKFLPLLVFLYTIYEKNFELRNKTGGKIREEYKFAKNFFEDQKNDLDKYILELGYLGITQSRSISSEEVKYILSLKEPLNALFWFKRSRKYLDFSITGLDRKIAYKAKYKKESSRKMYKFSRFSLYIFWALVAFSPVVYSAKLPPTPIIWIIIWMILCLTLAFIFLNEGVDMGLAEKLVKLQPSALRV
jgi:hypothetical protein